MSKIKRLLETKMPDEKTKVIFRKFSDGEAIALFPELPGLNKITECLSYQTIGQHGSASADIDRKHSWKAKPEEYASLKRELESLGYNLQVVCRFSYQMDQKRIAALHNC